ncbi:hypothetical protein GGI35DRAFT_211826 [Trichoderma velutinum]
MILWTITPYLVHVGTTPKCTPPAAKEAVLAWRNQIWQYRVSILLGSTCNIFRSDTVLTLHSSAALSGHVRHPSRGWSGIRKGYHPVVCCSRIELGEHMPPREYGRYLVVWSMEHGAWSMEHKYEYLLPTLRSSWPRPGFMLDRRLICFARCGLVQLE